MSEKSDILGEDPRDDHGGEALLLLLLRDDVMEEALLRSDHM